MKFQIYEELPGKGLGGKYDTIYAEAIDAACEHEPKWLRIDELATETAATASGRVGGLKKAVERYSARTGLTGFEVTQRRVDGKSYPFIRKVKNGGPS